MKTKSGEELVERFNRHLHPEVEALLPEALLRIESGGRKFFREQVDFGRVIGKTICVATNIGDNIVFAKRPNRSGYTRFVKNRQPEPTTFFSLIIKQGDMERGKLVLLSAYIGEIGEPEPWDRNAGPNSSKFWAEHALVWGDEEIVPGTETDICPW